MSNPLMVARKTEDVVIWPADYEARRQDIAVQLDEALTKAEQGDKRYGPQARKLGEQLDQMKDPANVDGVLILTFGAIPNVAEQRLKDEHPPRKGDQFDSMAGFNRETFPLALMHRCLISPEVSWEDFTAAVETWPAHLYDEAWETVRSLNHEGVRIPKSSAVSLVQQRLEDASMRRRGSE